MTGLAEKPEKVSMTGLAEKPEKVSMTGLAEKPEKMTEFEELLEEIFQRMHDPAVMYEAVKLCHDHDEPLPDWLAWLLIEYIKDVINTRRLN